MTLNLKIEIVKILLIEFSLSSDKNKREEVDENTSDSSDTAPESK